jgi:hypothetical protein
MAEKSILEQALLQIENLEEAVKQNAKGILGSVVKQELNGLLKESTKEEEEPAEQDVDDEDTDVDSDMGDVDAETDDAETDDVDADDVDADAGLPDEEDESGDEMPDVDSDDESPEMGSDDSVMDMTNASDEEVVKVFRAMKPEDGIVVKRDGNNLDVTIDGDEYVIKLDDYPSEDMNEDEMSDEMSEDDMEYEMSEEDMDEDVSEEDMTEDMEEEAVYEIELDGSDDEKPTETKEGKIEKPFKAAKGVKKVEATEAARTKWNAHGDKGGANRTGIKSKKVFKTGSGSLNEEVSKLRKQNDEYKKALVLFKEKLNEVAVFNASLAYATRLFTESSTTKQEKLNILKRFDSVSTMNESKQLYNTIKSELNHKKPVTESVAERISTTPKSSSSKDILAESKAYENPQFKRMKELMGKLK